MPAYNEPNLTGIFVAQPLRRAYVSTAAPLTLDYTHMLVDVTAAVTITLPTAVGITGRTYTITALIDGVEVIGTGGETIQGDASVVLLSDESLTVYSNGVNWGVE